MKLRLLNGSHSTLAYLGFLAGHEFIWQASSDPLLATLVERQMAEEIVPTLAAPPGDRPCRVLRAADRALSQPGAAAPDAADRDGRLAEAAAAAARHRARPARGRRVDRASRARGRRVDPLCERHRRARPRDRGVGPAGRRIRRIDRGDAGAIRRADRRGLPRSSRRSSAISPRMRAFRAAVTRNVVALFRDGVRADARRASRPRGERHGPDPARAPSRPPVSRRSGDARSRAPRSTRR